MGFSRENPNPTAPDAGVETHDNPYRANANARLSHQISFLRVTRSLQLDPTTLFGSVAMLVMLSIKFFATKLYFENTPPCTCRSMLKYNFIMELLTFEYSGEYNLVLVFLSKHIRVGQHYL